MLLAWKTSRSLTNSLDTGGSRCYVVCVMTVANCPVCGSEGKVSKLYAWSVTCDNCYDGAPDSGPQLIGHALTRDAAVSEWNEAVAEYVEENNA